MFENCCWRWKGCVHFNMLSIYIIECVFINMYYFSMHLYFMQSRSILGCILCFYLTSKLPSQGGEKKRHQKGLFSGNHVSQVFQASLNVKCVSNFSPSTTKMFLIFQHFCVQMHLPIWFLHSWIITKHPPIVLSVIIFKILQHSSCDECLLVGSDPTPGMGGYSSWEHAPKGCLISIWKPHTEGHTPKWIGGRIFLSLP